LASASPSNAPDVRSALALAGRLGLASLFLLGGVNKIANFSETAASMTEAGLPLAGVLLPVVIWLELVAGGLVVAGRWLLAPAALALAAFTLATNLVFHRFWEMDGLVGQLELSLFFKNVAIAGALVFVAASGTRPREVRP
jgi:putative oxidoreductase